VWGKKDKEKTQEVNDSHESPAPSTLCLVQKRTGFLSHIAIQNAACSILKNIGKQANTGGHEFTFHYGEECLYIESEYTNQLVSKHHLIIEFCGQRVFELAPPQDDDIDTQRKRNYNSYEKHDDSMVLLYIPFDRWLNLLEWLESASAAWNSATGDALKRTLLAEYVRKLSGEDFDEEKLNLLVGIPVPG
jgi:hypothetical protein